MNPTQFDSKSITRKKGDPEADSAAGLRREGLILAQHLSGGQWTDYNLHDPGVTILEQLCYALTDLIYCSGFDLADHLTPQTGAIDFEKQGLFRPQDILPSEAITCNDYRKILFDAIPEIDNVWVRTDLPIASDTELEAAQGYYDIFVKLTEKNEHRDNSALKDAVSQRVRSVFYANRNLCEDLRSISILRPKYYSLHGDIEVSGNLNVSVFLAGIYEVCTRRMTPRMPFEPYEGPFEDLSQDDLFSGPLCQHGYIDDATLEGEVLVTGVSELIGLIGGIEGVRFVARLWFEDDKGQRLNSLPVDPLFQEISCLKIPAFPSEVGIKLLKRGQSYPIVLQEMLKEYRRRLAEYDSLRLTPQHFESLSPLPEGQHLEVSEYYSIQHDFPEIYGINAFGVPRSEPDARQAKAKQLKAYLLFFEQLLANFLSNTAGLSRLFSLDEDLNQSYFSQALDQGNIPQVDGLYVHGLENIAEKVAALVASYDNVDDRRSRVLDYLLALYGEQFSQHALSHFNLYNEAAESGQVLIQNQLKVLKEWVPHSKDRAAAFDLTKAAWNSDNTAGLLKKLGVLLGVAYAQTRSLVDVFIEQGLELLTDSQFESLREGAVALAYVDVEDIPERLSQVFLKVPRQAQKTKIPTALFEQIVFLRQNVMSGDILRSGIDLETYRVGSATEGRFQLVFQSDNAPRALHIGAFLNIDDAVMAANELKYLLIKLNRESEGFHLVEHLLLRPPEGQCHLEIEPDFYAFSMTLVLPDWTARFHEPAFRRLVEETAAQNAPAHLMVYFLWLSFAEMNAFEVLYQRWLAAKAAAHRHEKETDLKKKLNAISGALARFLSSHRPGY